MSDIPIDTANPEAFRARTVAILLMVGDLYRNRETTGQGASPLGSIPMSTTVEALLAPYRRGIV